MVEYGAEGLLYATNSLTFSNNVLKNTLPKATGILDLGGVPVTGSGNSFDPSITTPVSPPSLNQLTTDATTPPITTPPVTTPPVTTPPVTTPPARRRR